MAGAKGVSVARWEFRGYLDQQARRVDRTRCSSRRYCSNRRRSGDRLQTPFEPELMMSAYIEAGIVSLLILLGIGILHRRRTLRAHDGLSEAEFASHFLQQGIPDYVSKSVYRHFRTLVGVPEFKPAPSDRIESIYGSDGYDLEYDLKTVLTDLGCEMPSSATQTRWEAPLTTIQDAVRWIDWARKGAPPSAK